MPSSISSSDRAFPLRVALVAGLIVAAYSVLIAVVRPELVVSYDAQTRNRAIAERYVDRATPDVVMVGSSIAAIFSRELMREDSLGSDIYNLAFVGGHTATGLDIVLRKPRWPRVVLIEMNVMDRGADPQFARDRFAEPWWTIRTTVPAFRLENRPLDLGIVALWQFTRDRVLRRSASPDVPARNPATFVDDREPDDSYRALVADSLRTIAEQVAKLRAHGVKIALIRFPAHSAIEASPRVHHMWSEAYRVFPRGAYDWVEFDKSGAYDTPDGIHLSIESARRVAVELRSVAARLEGN